MTLYVVMKLMIIVFFLSGRGTDKNNLLFGQEGQRNVGQMINDIKRATKT